MSWLLRNWELKLLALVVAVTLWFFVVGGEKSEIMLPARIEYMNIPSGMMLIGPTPETVDVQLKGLRSSLARLTRDDLRAQVNLARVGPGEAVVQLIPDSVVAPRDVTVLRVSPSRLRVTLEPVATAEVRVVPRVTGVPAPGHVVSRVAVTPPTVGLRGPRTEVEGRTEIQTAPVDVSGARAPVTRAVELAPAPGAVRLTTRTVEVTVEIREARGMHQRRTVR